MARPSTQNARPTADGVDPIQPERTNNDSFTSDATRPVNPSPAPAPTPAAEPERTGEAGVDFAVPGNDPSTVEKITVKTTGEFNLMDPWTGSHIGAGEEVEVVKSQFIADKLESGELEEA